MTPPRLGGPWLLLTAGVAAGVLAVVVDDLRLGGYLLALALAATAVLRAILPSRVMGAMAVRSRPVDVLLLGAAAAAAATLAAALKITS